MADNKYDNLFEVYAYINPADRKVEALYSFTFMGICERVDSDWKPIYREDSRLDEFTDGYIAYKIDWSIDPLDTANLDPTKEWPEHQIVIAFDEGTLDEELVKEYCKLVYDENGENPELFNSK